eukprot:TRINITY_DN990_c0_g1_i2.p1 TRINITY_DN990_c0_g1~~TRINITY_DN990_c0_g1_i2.p1  ORF type:complete len:146 (+),score=35.26 TRINITY_DN990_c0_g1_i2:64-501(+)
MCIRDRYMGRDGEPYDIKSVLKRYERAFEVCHSVFNKISSADKLSANILLNYLWKPFQEVRDEIASQGLQERILRSFSRYAYLSIGRLGTAFIRSVPSPNGECKSAIGGAKIAVRGWGFYSERTKENNLRVIKKVFDGVVKCHLN